MERKANIILFYRIGKRLLRMLQLTILFFPFVFLSNPELNSQTFKHNPLIREAESIRPVTKQPTKQSETDGTKIAVKKGKRQVSGDSITVDADSSDKRDRIISLTQSGDNHILKIEVKDTSSEITINIFNMLGKKVLEAYKGTPKSNPDEGYEIQSSRLPNGVYICVLIGKDFRKSEKFVVAR
jgi:hypothetical protein